jgi:hypothetical protein
VTVAFAMLLFGALIVYAGWKDLSVAALLKGDNTQRKPAKVGAGA